MEARAVIEKLANRVAEVCGLEISDVRAIEEMLAPLVGLIESSANMLEYLDEHDWGHVPEGETSEKWRAALRAVYEAAGGEK